MSKQECKGAVCINPLVSEAVADEKGVVLLRAALPAAARQPPACCTRVDGRGKVLLRRGGMERIFLLPLLSMDCI